MRIQADSLSSAEADQLIVDQIHAAKGAAGVFVRSITKNLKR